MYTHTFWSNEVVAARVHFWECIVVITKHDNEILNSNLINLSRTIVLSHRYACTLCLAHYRPPPPWTYKTKSAGKLHVMLSCIGCAWSNQLCYLRRWFKCGGGWLVGFLYDPNLKLLVGGHCLFPWHSPKKKKKKKEKTFIAIPPKNKKCNNLMVIGSQWWSWFVGHTHWKIYQTLKWEKLFIMGWGEC